MMQTDIKIEIKQVHKDKGFTREERFERDFKQRFFGKFIVSEDSIDNLSLITRMNSCTRKGMIDWVNNWAIKNSGLDKETMNLYMYSINAQVKDAILADTDRQSQ